MQKSSRYRFHVTEGAENDSCKAKEDGLRCGRPATVLVALGSHQPALTARCELHEGAFRAALGSVARPGTWSEMRRMPPVATKVPS